MTKSHNGSWHDVAPVHFKRPQKCVHNYNRKGFSYQSLGRLVVPSSQVRRKAQEQMRATSSCGKWEICSEWRKLKDTDTEDHWNTILNYRRELFRKSNITSEPRNNRKPQKLINDFFWINSRLSTRGCMICRGRGRKPESPHIKVTAHGELLNLLDTWIAEFARV